MGKVFEFDYDNFIEKSKQQHYDELKKEIEDTLDAIKTNAAIPGVTKEQKKHNLLMHYENKRNGLEFRRDKMNINVATLTAYVSAAVAILMLLIPYEYEYMGAKEVITTSDWFIACGIIIVFIIAITVIFYCLQYLHNKYIEKEIQKFLYYDYYYNQLKKYIKEDK